ncbi:MAG: hypothetical protein LCH67_19300 [Bacteroidetes bacterium]|nr:hypothetical protein [Bacteroidota bacterium]
MNYTIQEVKTKKQFGQFINLPAAIHKNHKNWVPPIYADDRAFFNPQKNYLFESSDTILLLAYEDEKPVGRIMGIINRKYNEEHGENDARFCFIETYENPEIAKVLIEAIENWARAHKTENLVGPLGFSDKDPQGLMIMGFDEPQVIATNGNFEYMVRFVENLGFSKRTDLVVYKMDIPDKLPEFYHKIKERAQRNNPNLRVVEIKSKRAIKPLVRPVLSLVNETFKDIYAFTPMTDKEMDEFADRYLMILDPRFLKVIQNENNEIVAFVLGMPDISEGIIKCKGKLFPFGFLQILWSQRKTKQLNLLLGGIKPRYRNTGIDTIMGVEMLEEAKKAGMTHIDSHLELEDNLKMRAEMEKLGGVVYKKFRVYQKRL